MSLFTDASFCPDTRVAAWAAWMRWDGGCHRFSGPFRENPSGPTQAEAMAVVNGLFLAVEAIRPAPKSKVLIQSDCLMAIDVFSPDWKPRREKSAVAFGPIVERFHSIVRESGLIVSLRHVRGHRGTATARNAVNTWCDLASRREMKAARRRALIGEAHD